ncbi:hypothetical protein [Nocardioides aequoreus]|uniref:hypothetical protein n=1 Tax=Nocardioides aequoreus TaxID=397278 RepID=UPI0004C361C3|nr:hypothetical protein [Nocardioides aequoreus]
MTTTLRRSIATATIAGLVAGPLAVMTAGPASAKEREGRCSGAEFQLEVEKEDGRFEVDADIDDARPGERWKVALRHEGRLYVNKTYRADGDGDISIDRNRPNTRGKDTFSMTVKKVGTSKRCTHVISFRR